VTGEHANTSSARAEDVHGIAVDWMLQKRDCESWNEQDQKRLDDWLAESSAHLVAYWRAEASWKRTEVLSALRQFRSVELLPSAPRRRRVFSTITATGFAVAALGAVMLYQFLPRYTTYSTAIGGHKTLALGDGSQVELNTDTVVRVADVSGQRKVVLEKGEAFFQVKHDSNRPFIVMAQGHRITDLGTKFLVRENEDQTEIALVEGRARFDDKDRDGKLRSLVLAPGDVVSATADSVSLTRKTVALLGNELGWRRGVLVFKHTVLGEAVEEFNRYNARKLVIADPAVARLEIRGTFRTEDMAVFADMARDALGLRVSARGNDLVIAR
jgi:transmembrane sensor